MATRGGQGGYWPKRTTKVSLFARAKSLGNNRWIMAHHAATMGVSGSVRSNPTALLASKRPTGESGFMSVVAQSFGSWRLRSQIDPGDVWGAG